MHQLGYLLGLTSANRWPYLLWSGSAAFIEGISGLAVLGFGYRLIECNVNGCHRPGLHHVIGAHLRTCRSHHPTGGNTATQIRDAHHQAR